MTEVAALTGTLPNICLDVQISICMFLHPSDILALRKTCKALQPSTRQRVVWVAALHRVCLDNALFLPSFPIADMSDLELEKSAMAPRRWIELCSTFEQPKSVSDPGAILRPRATRIIDGSFPTEVNYNDTEISIVPGGRYLLSYSPDIISILDLGYTSSADCKLIASVRPEGGCEIQSCRVQATPDGMGLTIISSNAENCYVYEIYPQSETPHLTQIAHLGLDLAPTGESEKHISIPDLVFWFIRQDDMIIFWVWDYRLDHSISFSVDFVQKFEFEIEVMATKTAVIVISQEAILICAIPPLSSRPPVFFDQNSTHITPLFTIPFPDPFPDGFSQHSEFLGAKTISSWYFGWTSLYFDMFFRDSKIYGFQIILKPDLSAASLHVINSSEHRIRIRDFTVVLLQGHDYRICDKTLVSCWFYQDHIHPGQYDCGVYAGLKFTRFAVITHGGPAVKRSLSDPGRGYLLSSCPASGRSVLLDLDNRCIVVFDFF